MNDIERFWSKVDRSSDCWRWIGQIDAYGYGKFGVGGRSVKAHRFAYEVTVGPIPDGLVIDHLCRNRSCVRPTHLEPVTDRENRLRGVAAKVKCVNGHDLTGPNVQFTAGRRNCRTCNRAAVARYKARKKAGIA